MPNVTRKHPRTEYKTTSAGDVKEKPPHSHPMKKNSSVFYSMQLGFQLWMNYEPNIYYAVWLLFGSVIRNSHGVLMHIHKQYGLHMISYFITISNENKGSIYKIIHFDFLNFQFCPIIFRY